MKKQFLRLRNMEIQKGIPMTKKIILSIIAVVAILGLWQVTRSPKSSNSPSTQETKDVESSYWTCPMHPQVHQDHPGECPICHMKLIKVSEKNVAASAQATKQEHLGHTALRVAAVMATSEQLERIGVQKVSVEKMDLTLHIPVSGRFISASTVAFQVYESDLRYIKSGLAFKGENNLYPEVEVIGAISSVDSLVDPTSRTVRVLGSVRNGPKFVLPETTFRGDIEVNLKKVLSIPESSVLHTGKDDIVYVIHDGGHLMAKIVKLGIKTEGFYEVLAGLSENDTISSGPNFLIDSEAKIKGAQTEGQTSGHSRH